MNEEMALVLADEAATLAFGARLAAVVGPGLIRLEGDLGAGKTCLVRGLLRALGHQGRVKSPTYTLVEGYATTRLTVSHWDLYRLGSADELDALGLRECDRNHELILIEWPERGGQRLHAFDLAVRLDYAGNGRVAHLRAGSALGRAWLDALQS
jgi:tRNA threonylcarbamoyladenosine biosynthesis protein TsaE